MSQVKTVLMSLKQEAYEHEYIFEEAQFPHTFHSNKVDVPV